MIVYTHLLVILLLLHESVRGSQSIKQGKQYVSSTANLLRARGYLAEDHFVPVQEGAAILNLVRATNPLINNGHLGLAGKDPVLFSHGLLTSANSFILNSDNVVPKNYSSFNVRSMSLRKLKKLLRDEPASKSLVFTALNFGHEVWLLNRRPTFESQYAYLFHHGFAKDFANFNEMKMTIQLESLEHSGYWDFSFENQVVYDTPEIIDYILDKTDREKLAYVGHSAGSVIMLGAYILKPEVTNKISKAILWAPAIHDRIRPPAAVEIFNSLIPSLVKEALPVPSMSTVHQLEDFIASICNPNIRGLMICNSIADLLFGPGTNQQLMNFKKENKFLGGLSSHEAAQALRAFSRGMLYPLEQVEETILPGSPADEHLFYNVSKIKSKSISLWAGNTDALIPVEIMDNLIGNFTVPVERHAIGSAHAKFNHIAFVGHEKISTLLIIPSLKTLESE